MKELEGWPFEPLGREINPPGGSGAGLVSAWVALNPFKREEEK